MSLSIKSDFREGLECSICANLFKKPKQLFCGHTFCLSCVEKLLSEFQKVIVCPTCREVTRIPEHGLRTNYVILDLALKVENMELELKLDDIEDCATCQKMINKSEVAVCKICSDIHVCSNCALKFHKEHEIYWLMDVALLNQKKKTEIVINNLASCSKKLVNEVLMCRDLFFISLSKICNLISAKLAMFDDIIKQMSDCGGVILEKYLCLFVKQAYQIYSSINLVSTEIKALSRELSHRNNWFEEILNSTEVTCTKNETLNDILKDMILPTCSSSVTSVFDESGANPFAYHEKSSKFRLRKKNYKFRKS